MPKVTVDVAPEIIKWVINQVREYEIYTSLKEKLIKWQMGEIKPTFKQIETLSKQTNIPFGYFFLQEPPVEDTKILEYRTINSIELENPSRELIDTIDNMESIQEWMRNYQIKQGYNTLDIVGSAKDNMDARAIADIMRKDLGLKEDWYCSMENSWKSFKFLRTIFQDLGILIMLNGVVGQNTRRPLNIEEFRAFTLLDMYAPLVFINSCDSANGKLFSLIHEAAHIWIGSDNFYNDRYGNAKNVSDLETICNSVAAEILVPNNIFINEWMAKDPIEDDTERIEALSKIFKCGMTVIARRAFDNNFIDRSEYETIAKNAINHYNQSKSVKSDGGNFYNNIVVKNDRRLILALNSSIHEGTTQFTDAYRITNTNRKTFSGLVDKVRGIDL